jgi:hypothetical protein
MSVTFPGREADRSLAGLGHLPDDVDVPYASHIAVELWHGKQTFVRFVFNGEVLTVNGQELTLLSQFKEWAKWSGGASCENGQTILLIALCQSGFVMTFCGNSGRRRVKLRRGPENMESAKLQIVFSIANRRISRFQL